MTWLRQQWRRLRVWRKQVAGIEPIIRTVRSVPLEFHGGAAGGWSIVRGVLNKNSVVVDVGLGEELSFSESLIQRYGCIVNGFDPTPRAITYARAKNLSNLRLFETGLGAAAGETQFFLPKNKSYVSGSINRSQHLETVGITVPLISIDEVFDLIEADHIDLLKLDIEGAEYDVLKSDSFRRRSSSIRQLCVEFHHRWESRGKASTETAIAELTQLGFRCVWASPTTNEEFTFLQTAK